MRALSVGSRARCRLGASQEDKGRALGVAAARRATTSTTTHADVVVDAVAPRRFVAVAAAAASPTPAVSLARRRRSRMPMPRLRASPSPSSSAAAAASAADVPSSSSSSEEGGKQDDDREKTPGLNRPPTGRLSRLLSQRAEATAAASPPPRLGVAVAAAVPTSPSGSAVARAGVSASSSTADAASSSPSASPPSSPSSLPLPPPTDAARDEVMRLVALLPPPVAAALAARPDLDAVVEVVMDLGRPPLARLPFPTGDVALSAAPVTREDIDAACASVGDFGDDNRAGVDRTLHRVSAMRNRDGRVVGLTCRVGRAVRGSADAAADLVSGTYYSSRGSRPRSSSSSSSSPRQDGDSSLPSSPGSDSPNSFASARSTAGRPASVLLLGRPGVGKTTAIREIARLLADDVGRRVVVVDTSNEIAGDGDVPHAALGSARRLMVSKTAEQHRVMVEAVENHMPECVVIDEVGTEAEALACRTIAQRGVQLVATAHGGSLASLIKNPALSDLIGGIECVTLGDDEARRRSGQSSGGRKTALERAAPPAFDAAVEMLEPGLWRVHADLAASVDAALSGASQALCPVPTTRLRVRAADGGVLSLPADAPVDDALALRGMTTRAAVAAMSLVLNSGPSSSSSVGSSSFSSSSSSSSSCSSSGNGAAAAAVADRRASAVEVIKEPDAAVAAAVAAALETTAAISSSSPSSSATASRDDDDHEGAGGTAQPSSLSSLFSNPPDTMPGPGLQARGGGYSYSSSSSSLVGEFGAAASPLLSPPPPAALRIYAYGLPDADVWAAARGAGLIDEGGGSMLGMGSGSGGASLSSSSSSSTSISSSASSTSTPPQRRLCLAPRLDAADVVLALRARAKESPRLRDAAREAGVPVYAVKTGTTQALQRALRALLGLDPSAGGMTFGKKRDRGKKEGDDEESDGDSNDASSSSSSSRKDDGASSSYSSSEDEEEEEEELGSEAAVSLSAAGAAAAAAASARTAAFVAEARGAVEGVVLPCNQPCELRPAPESARAAQVALAASYGLRAEIVGGGSGNNGERVRILAPEEATTSTKTAATTKEK